MTESGKEHTTVHSIILHVLDRDLEVKVWSQDIGICETALLLVDMDIMIRVMDDTTEMILSLASTTTTVVKKGYPGNASNSSLQRKLLTSTTTSSEAVDDESSAW